MTTRRGFLGLLAAAPIAAPIVAKELAAPMLHSGGFVRGIAGESLTLTLDHDWGKPDGREIARLRGLLRAPTPWTTGEITADKLDVGHLQMPLNIPNRLCGVEINQEGEAI